LHAPKLEDGTAHARSGLHHIQRKISTRELRAGEPVSDVTIARELGISRTPAREAIRQLVSEGLLEAVPGRGVVVITLARDDIRELFEMREALEGLAARTVAQRTPSEAEIRDLRAVAGALSGLIKELETSRKPVLDEKQMERFEVADLAFHTYIMRLAGNRRSMKTLAGIRMLIRIFTARRRGHSLATLKQIQRDHADLIRAIQKGDAPAAAECVHRHIAKSQKSRLEEFDQREREAGLPQDVNAFLAQIRTELL
jgi:DNA-binding GntR family transcriptional regulator